MSSPFKHWEPDKRRLQRGAQTAATTTIFSTINCCFGAITNRRDVHYHQRSGQPLHSLSGTDPFKIEMSTFQRQGNIRPNSHSPFPISNEGMHEQRNTQQTHAIQPALHVNEISFRKLAHSIDYPVRNPPVLPSQYTMFALNPRLDVRSQKGPDWTNPKILEPEAHVLASLAQANHPDTGYTSLNDHPCMPKPEVVTVLPTKIKCAKELDFDATDVFALFSKQLLKSTYASESFQTFFERLLAF